jgi:hypothetical protein
LAALLVGCDEANLTRPVDPSSASPVTAPTNEPRLKLDGDAESSAINIRLVIHAQLQTSGGTTGFLSYGCRRVVCADLGVPFPGTTLQVVQLVPPSALYPWWCVNAPTGSTVLRDEHLLMYVSDIGNGKTGLDQLSFFFGSNADRLVTPAPVGEPFHTVDFGDYTGKVRL